MPLRGRGTTRRSEQMTPTWSELIRRCLWLAYDQYRVLRRSWRHWRVSRRQASRLNPGYGAPIRVECRSTFVPYVGGGGYDAKTGESGLPYSDEYGDYLLRAKQ